VKINDLEKNLLDEIFKALGLGYSHPLRPLIEPLFSLAAHRFAKLAVSFDHDVNNYNFNNAARRILPIFTREVRAYGAENIPTVGPLLIVSNHPGTVDGLVIASQLPRPDLKIITSGVPFIRNLAATANHLIYSGFDTFERMKVVRAAVRHERDGGAVLIFPKDYFIAIQYFPGVVIHMKTQGSILTRVCIRAKFKKRSSHAERFLEIKPVVNLIKTCLKPEHLR